MSGFFTQSLHGLLQPMDFLARLCRSALTAASRLAQNPFSAGIQATGAAAAASLGIAEVCGSKLRPERNEGTT